jgi:hypothetical protein
MLKKKTFLTIALVLGVMLAFSLMGCDTGTTGGGGNPQTVTYIGGTGSNAYRLEITENTARYVAQTGDNFKLIEVISTKTMFGTVEISNGGITITLIPSNGSPITVTVSGNNINSISGNSLWSDGSSFTGPGTLEQGGDGGMDWPPDAMLSQVGLGGLSRNGATDIQYVWYPDEGHGAGIYITFTGNANTKSSILSYFANKSWEYDQDYFENNNEYHYVTEGDPSYNVFFHWTTSGSNQSGSIQASADYGW